MSNLLKDINTYNRQEREEISKNIINLYNNALKDQDETFALTKQKPRSLTAKHNYLEAVQRLGAMNDILEALHIDYCELEANYYGREYNY